MNKDAYYFPHFCNARSDRKIRRVRKELGIEGYAIYFMLLEVLREQEDFSYPLSDIDLLADEFQTSEQKIDVVIKNYELFEIDEHQNFFSYKQIEYLKPYLERSKRARTASLKRWGTSKKQSNNANAMQMLSASNASKVKESKVNDSIYSDSFLEFWESYGKKKEKRKCAIKWNRLKESDKNLILEFIPIYKNSVSSVQYQKNPYTFLNSGIWEDDWSSYTPNQQSVKSKGNGQTQRFIEVGQRLVDSDW